MRASFNGSDDVRLVVESCHRWQRISGQQLQRGLAAGGQVAYLLEWQIETANRARQAVAADNAPL